MPFAVDLKNVTRRFGKVVALSSLNLQIERGIFFSLLGPSGCGKTTVLRLIAGLDAPDEGVISIEGTDVRSVPPNRRPVNTVFQSYALFPHMTVEENISFGPRMRNEKPDAIQERANEVMRLTRTESFSARRPHQLSGGQKQRVALARALVNRPSILLLDEPLAALDLKLREELRDQLKELQRATKTTFIYVTHDQTEALAMSDSIAIMDAGKILQQGAGAELYRAPQTSFVAEFLGRANILAATLVRREGQLLWARFGDQEIKFAGSSSANLGDEILLSLRLEAGQIHRPVDSHENAFSGVLQNIIHLGPQVEMQMRVNQKIIRHLLPAAAADLLELRRGEPVTLTLSPDEITLLAS